MVDLLNWFVDSEVDSIKGFSNDFCTKKNKLNIKDNLCSFD